MSSTRLKSLLARVVLSVAGLSAAGASHAIIYSGHWDPTFGGQYQDLGWTASATFSSDDGCTGLCGVSFLTVEVSFYNANDPLRRVLETFEISSASSIGGEAYSDATGQVVGLRSDDYFAPFVPTSTGAASSIDGGGRVSFNLVFGDPSSEALPGPFAQLDFAPPSGIGACDDEGANPASCGQSANPAVGTFQVSAVPEPATGVLMAAGLGLLAVFSKRRRRNG